MIFKGKERKLVLVLSLLFILGILSLTTLLIEFKPFSKTPTGQVTAIPETKDEYTGKYCFFNVGEETISMYSCNEQIDCKNKFDKLRMDLENMSIDTTEISVIKCASFED
jgi:hypothetical protein